MENLNREAILRMLSGKTGNSSSVGGGVDIDLAGYATSIWVTENFVSIDFFRELFRAFDSNSNEILPNDTTSVVASIKAMVGTWTEEYLTALGNAGGGGGGGGGAQYLNDLLDVQLTTPLTDGQALVYNATLQKWVNGAAGVNMTTVWNALAGSTNEQINASHLSTALSGYVTTSAISDMATQTWVNQQGFATQTWVTSNFITIAYFDRLFRAYNGSTLVSHNDTTSTIDNIKAMFGFWTEFYLSALGTGGVSSVSISLSQLADVNVAGVTNGQVLSYNSTSGTWVPATVSGGGTDMSTVWTNLAAATNEQINISHLTTALSGYATTSALGSYLPLTGGALTGMLTMNATLYMNTNNLYYEKTFQTGASRHAEFGSPSGLIYDSIGDPAIGFVNDGSAVGEERFTFGIGWYGNFVGRIALFNGFMKRGSSDQYVLLGGGGHKLLSEIGGSGNYLPLAGGSMTGAINFNFDTTYTMSFYHGEQIDNYANIYLANNVNSTWGVYAPYTGAWTLKVDYEGITTGSLLVNDTSRISMLATRVGAEPRLIMQYNDNGQTVGNLSFYNDGTFRLNQGFDDTTRANLEVRRLLSYQLHASNACDFNGDVSIGTSSSIGNTGLTVYSFSNFRYGMTIYKDDDRPLYVTNNQSTWCLIAFIEINNYFGYRRDYGRFFISKDFEVYGSCLATSFQNVSDIRKKDIIESKELSVMGVANAPSFTYRWKDMSDKTVHVGSSAQYWQTLLPEAVTCMGDEMHTLSMQYDVIALIASIAIAKKVVSHEEQIRLLETRVSELEKENDKLRKLIA